MRTSKYILIIAAVLTFFSGIRNSYAQDSGKDLLRFYVSDSMQFLEKGKILREPFTGGINLPVISQVDLNNDGKPDIVVFDRAGNKVLTYMNTGVPSNYNYEYAPQFEYIFDQLPLNIYVLFRDFNQDGKPDLFTLEGDGRRFKVYMNTTTPSDTLLQLRKMGDIYFRNNQSTGNLYNRLGGRYADLPVIDDIDGDGDLDYINFESVFGNLQLYVNEQVEKGLPNDTFAFRLVDLCWGGFREAANNELIMNCNRQWFPNDLLRNFETERRHAVGTTLLSIDLDNDGDKELIMGNGEFKNLLNIKNGKKEHSLTYDTMISYVPYFPSNDEHEINMKYTPALYHFDVDGDGVKDLLTAPYFVDSFIASENIWFAKNMGSNAFPDFKIHNRKFLSDESIDLGKNVSPVFWDIDKDGLIDLLVAVEPDTMKKPFVKSTRIYRYNNVGTSRLPKFELVDTNFANFGSLNQTGVTLAIGDLDNDGKEDIVAGNYHGRILLLKNTSPTPNAPNPTFQLSSSNLIGESVGYYAAPALFDYSRDGKPDLIIGKHDGFFSYYENTSTTSSISFTKITDKFGNARTNFFRESYNPPAFETNGYSAPFFFDFENDGKPELVSGSLSGHIKMWHISYDPHYTFPEVTDFYGIINAERDTLWGIGFGAHTKVAIARLRDSSNADVLVGTNRGGFKFLSSSTTPRPRVNVPNIGSQIYKLSIYPNPNKGEFSLTIPVELQGKELQFDIRDYTGRVLKTIGLSDHEHIIHFEAANGIYIGTLAEENGLIVGTCKIVVNR